MVTAAAGAYVAGWPGYPFQLAHGIAWIRDVAITTVLLAQMQLVLVLWRWHQDQRLLRRLRDDRGTPISIHSATAEVFPGILALVSSWMATGASVLIAPPAEVLWAYLLGAVMVLTSIVALCVEAPRNSVLIQVFDSGIRLVAKGCVEDLAWTELRYECDVDPEYQTTTYRLRTPKTRPLTLPDELTRFNDLLHTLTARVEGQGP